jgi:phosphotransferase system IIA component
VNGFGAGQVQYYRYAWDKSATHTWTDSETQWSSGTLVTLPTSAGTWYLHIKGYNGANVGNGTSDYSVTVNAKALTPAGIGASNKIYDGNITATLTGTPGTLLGVVSGDTVTLGGTAAGTFGDKNVGTGKTVTVSGQTLGGGSAGNYTLTEPTATANITTKGLTVTGITANNKAYDGNTSATLNVGGAALVGKVGTEDVTLNSASATGAFADADVGTGKAVYVSGLTISGGDIGNYSLTQPTATANITPAGLTVAGVEAESKVYDGTTNATLIVSNAVLVGVLSGDTVSLDTTNATGAFADKNVGTGKTVTVSGLALLGPDAGKYTLTQPTTNADITAVALTVTGVTANSKPYDGNNTATLGGTAALSAGVVGSEDVTLGGTPAATFDTKNVGTAKPVTVTGFALAGADIGNYTLSQPAGLAADITQAVLTVTGLGAQNKVYDGTTAATLTGTAGLAGVFGSDDVSLSGTASGAFADANVGTGKTVTISGLSLTGGDAGNYSLTAPTAVADITGAGTTTALVSSVNPSAPGSNVTFTATVSSGVGTPEGDVVFLASGAPFSTNALAGGVAAASTMALPLGTNAVAAQYAAQGNYLGSNDSLDQVVKVLVTCSQTNAIVGIADNLDGTFTLTFIGTPQAQYYVVASPDVGVPMGSWTPLAGSTNTVTNIGGQWQITVTNTAAQQYYRSTAVVPCP